MQLPGRALPGKVAALRMPGSPKKSFLWAPCPAAVAKVLGLPRSCTAQALGAHWQILTSHGTWLHAHLAEVDLTQLRQQLFDEVLAPTADASRRNDHICLRQHMHFLSSQVRASRIV